MPVKAKLGSSWCPALEALFCPPWGKVVASKSTVDKGRTTTHRRFSAPSPPRLKEPKAHSPYSPLVLQCQEFVKSTDTSRKTDPKKARRKDKESPQQPQEEPKLYLEEAVLERKIPDADLRQLVDLPAGLDYNEWLASHTLAFFDHINLLYGTISEFCTQSGCPDMVGPSSRQYQWFDEKGKKCKVAAPQYVDYVMTFTQKTINDESIFPTKFANEFPSSYESIVKKILRLLFHVMAHIYHAHFREIVLLNLHGHLNCLFAHFVLFNERFKMIEDKETEVLHDLVLALKLLADGVAELQQLPSEPADDERFPTTQRDDTHESGEQRQTTTTMMTVSMAAFESPEEKGAREGGGGTIPTPEVPVTTSSLFTSFSTCDAGQSH